MARWKIIADFPDYAVSDTGCVQRLGADCRNRPGRMLAQCPAPNGYMTVQLFINRKGTTQRVHRLVCAAFHGPAPFPGAQAAHYDGDKKNNHASNLRWATAKANAADKVTHGTMARGIGHGLAKLTEDDVRKIRATSDSTHALARRYKMDRATISDIRTRKTWRHVI